jgi:hypothetical protein
MQQWMSQLHELLKKTWKACIHFQVSNFSLDHKEDIRGYQDKKIIFDSSNGTLLQFDGPQVQEKTELQYINLYISQFSSPSLCQSSASISRIMMQDTTTNWKKCCTWIHSCWLYHNIMSSQPVNPFHFLLLWKLAMAWKEHRTKGSRDITYLQHPKISLFSNETWIYVYELSLQKPKTGTGCNS